MDRPQVVVEQLHVTPGYLKRRRAVAENTLEREDISAIREEGAREAMAEDVRRASRRDPRRQGQAMDELLDRARRQAIPSSADEERIAASAGPRFSLFGVATECGVKGAVMWRTESPPASDEGTGFGSQGELRTARSR
jgi:hypothetical protein